MVSKFKTFSIFFILFLLWGGAGFAAAVVIDSTVFSTGPTGATHLGASPTVVFVSDQTGYDFYRDADGTCVYRKTINGGTSWGNATVIDSQTDCLGIGVWYDAWTPHYTATRKIHVLTWDTGSSHLWYTEFNPATDSASTTVDISSSQTATVAFGLNYGAITRTATSNGALYVGLQSAGGSFVLKCSSNCTSAGSWSVAGSNPFDLADDFLILEPLASGNLLAIRWDISADDIQSKVYDVISNTWDGGWTDIDTNATDSALYDTVFSAVVDPATDKIYLIYGANLAGGGADDEIRSAVYSSGWTAKSKVISNTGQTPTILATALAIDSQTGTLYALYSGRESTSGSVNVYYKTSSDGMATWSTAQAPLGTNGNWYGLQVNSVSNDRLYASWFEGFPIHRGNTLIDLTPPVVTMNSTTKTVGEGDGSSSITVNLNTTTRSDVVVDFTVSHVSTTSGDYTFSTSSVVIPAGSSSATIPFTITDDSNIETNEVFNVTLSGGVGITLGSSLTTAVTINDNEAPPTIAFSSATFSGSEATTPGSLTVSTSAVSGYDVTVNYAVSGGTATGGGVDFTLASGTATILAGSTSTTIPITIVNDALYETNETIDVTLSNPTNATLGSQTTTTYTINDNDAAPLVSFTSAAQSSSNESGTLTVTAQLSAVSGQNVTVPYTVTGTAIDGSDYTISASPITILAGTLLGSATITITSDTVDEPDETVVVTMGTPTNATAVGNTTHTATITDDDSAPTLVINDVTVDEAAGTANVSVTMTGTSSSSVSVNYQTTTGGTAVDGDDYTSASGTLTWTAGQTGDKTFSVSIINDVLDENDETINLTLSAPVNSTISDSAGIVTITDNDLSPTVSFTSASQTSADESGTLVVVAELSAVSGKAVTVPFTLSGTATEGVDYSVSPSSISIPIGATTGSATISITADAIDESDETAILTIDTPTNATVGSTNIHTATITDDDTFGVTVLESGSSTNVTEGNSAADTYTVVLTSQPTDVVTITLTPDAQVSVDHATLTFDSSNWNVVQTVSVSAVDDAVAEGNHTGTIAHSVASSDTNYNGFSISDVVSNITDNDTFGVSVIESSGSTNITEGGATDTYTIVLTSQPTATVTIGVTPDAQVSVDQASLSFTTSNWNTPQTITVTAVDDASAEGNHTGAIAHTSSSADTNYNGLAVLGVTASITDNDSFGVSVVESSGSTNVTEGGATDTYDIVLTSQPTSDVTVTINPDAQVTTDVLSLTFTTSNWNVPQTVTVSAVDDGVAQGNHAGTITHSATSVDVDYNGVSINSVTVAITENDLPSINIADVTVGEADGVATITLTLDGVSSSNVSVDYHTQDDSALAGSDYAASSGTMTWLAGETGDKTFTISITSDSIYESVESFQVILSNESNANLPGLAGSVQINDDEATPSVAFTLDNSSGSESTPSANLEVSLSGLSSTDVSVDYAVTGGSATTADYVLANGTLTIPAGSSSAVIPLTIVNDNLDESDETVEVTLSNPTSVILGAQSTYIYTIFDDDTFGVSIVESGGITNLTEGLPVNDTFTVVLNSQPIAPVQIDLNVGSQVVADQTSLNFDDTNWNVPVTITLSAVDDSIAESVHSGFVSFVTTSGDPSYQSLIISDVEAHITDNDSAGISVSSPEGSLVVSESGLNDTLIFVLTSEPTASVNILINPATGLDVNTNSLTFTVNDWNVPQTITVSATDNQVVDGLRSLDINFAVTSSDINYDAYVVPTETVAVTDNDSAGVVITLPLSGLQVTEGGVGGEVSVVLASEPTSSVTLHFPTDTQVVVTPADLIFDASNWNIPQTITVSAVDDDVAEGNHSSTITPVVVSADPLYSAQAPASFIVSLTDNDTFGVSIVESSGTTSVSEGGESDDITLVLTSQPLSSVTVTLTSSANQTVAPDVLVFTPSDWSVAQSVTVTAVDDFVAETNESGVISFSVESDDSFYNHVSVPSLVTTIVDNDVAGFEVSPLSLEMTEGEAGSLVTLSLSSAPTDVVTVTVVAGTAVVLDQTTLTFTASNFDVPQTVLVVPVDDTVVQGDQTDTLQFLLVSGDTQYDGRSASVALTIHDNDTETPPDDEDPSGQVTPVKASAGSDRTVLGGSRVTLNASDSEGSGLSYAWSKVSGEAEIDGSVSEKTVDVIVDDVQVASDVTIKLTVTDSKKSKSIDQVVLHVLPSKPFAEDLDSAWGGRFGSLIYTSGVVPQINGVSRNSIVIGKKTILLPEDGEEYYVAMTSDGYLAFGFPQLEEGRGVVYLALQDLQEFPTKVDLDKVTATFDGALAVSDALIAGSDDDLFIKWIGGAKGDHLGQYLLTLDVNNDSADDLLVSAPGEGEAGVAYTLTDSWKILSVTHGTSTHPIYSLLAGPSSSSTNSVLLASHNRSENQSLSVINGPVDHGVVDRVTWILGSDLDGDQKIFDTVSGTEVVLTQKEASVLSAAVGDVNHDKKDDLVLVTSTGDLFVFFGSLVTSGSLTTDQADVHITNVGDISMLQVGDVTGDGVDDIVLGDPEASDHLGEITVIFGRSDWEKTWALASDESVLVITGVDDQDGIGADLVLDDADGDSVSDIYTLRQTDIVVRYTLGKAAVQDTSANPASGGSGCSCSFASQKPVSIQGAILLVSVFGFLLLSVRRRVRV